MNYRPNDEKARETDAVIRGAERHRHGHTGRSIYSHCVWCVVKTARNIRSSKYCDVGIKAWQQLVMVLFSFPWRFSSKNVKTEITPKIFQIKSLKL